MITMIERYSPPGYNVKWEKRFITVSLVISTLLSLGFFANLIRSVNRLYFFDGGKRYLKANASCSLFSENIGVLMHGFTVTAITCIFFMIIRKAYLYQNSKSIYTVRRLPIKIPVFRITLPVPLMYFLTVLLVKYIILVVYMLVYLLSVPKEAIPIDWLDGIWRL